MPAEIQSPQKAYVEWQANPWLFRLKPENFSTEQIQHLADEGYVILISYFNPRGKSHLAFVGNSRLVMSTIPQIKKLEGKSASDLGSEWLPVVVQAGTYTGVTSIVYASNGWLEPKGGLFESGNVMFYLIRV